MMPVLFPLGNYYFVGPRYFREPLLFAVGTALTFGLYWLSIVVLTAAVRAVIRRLPSRERAILRTLVLFPVVGGLTTALAAFDVWVYSRVPLTGVRFSWEAVWPICLLGYIFDLFLCTALILLGPDPARRGGATGTLPRLTISPLEWGFHGLAVLVFIPIANHLLIGPRYWTDGLLLGLGSAVVTLLYIPTAAVLTLVVRLVIAAYPGLRQTRLRIGLMVLLTSLSTFFLIVGGAWIVSQIRVLEVPFSRTNLATVLGLGMVFNLLFCLAHGYFYSQTMWQRQQVENAQLKKQTLQHQLDALKGQLNPHFLFNSLNSLSSLISEDTEQAERFVDDLARVYRYLLQGGTATLVSLQAELDFVQPYTRLLQTRYGGSLRFEQAVKGTLRTGCLPPLTLQTLIDNAVRHNSMQPNRPLTIRIETTEEGWLQVWNNRQEKRTRLETGRTGLANLTAKYQLLGGAEPQIVQEQDFFAVTVPLLTHDRC